MSDKSDHKNDSDDYLDFRDLLVDEQNNVLTEYLSLSFSSDGENTRVTVTTTDDDPVSYTSQIKGVSVENLKTLIEYGLSDSDLDI